MSGPARSVLQGLHLHFDPVSGVAGDMAVAALVDVGVPTTVVAEAVKAMGVPGLRVRFEPRVRGAYAAQGFVVETPESGKRKSAGRVARSARLKAHAHDHHHDHPDQHDHSHDHPHDHSEHAHRDYAEIRRLLRRAKLDPDAKALAEEIFARVAEVEAALHGMPVDRVAFHEVGAFDSIADIVGASAAIAWLAPVAISSSPVVVGTGTVRTAHGVIPVPAPATAALLADAPLRFEGTGELTTPTGAALLAAIVDRFGAPPPLRLIAAGYGAGTRELADRANVLRVLLGQPIGAALPPAAEEVVLFEANIDDMSGEMLAALFEALFAAGALDVWSTPILMKKGRPAQQVSALAAHEQVAAVQRAFFLNSTTLGVRLRPVERAVLSRSLVDVETPYGRVRLKVGALDGEVLGAEPEFDDCRRRATAAGVPVKRVWAAAISSASKLLPASSSARARKRSRS